MFKFFKSKVKTSFESVGTLLPSAQNNPCAREAHLGKAHCEPLYFQEIELLSSSLHRAVLKIALTNSMQWIWCCARYHIRRVTTLRSLSCVCIVKATWRGPKGCDVRWREREAKEHQTPHLSVKCHIGSGSSGPSSPADPIVDQRHSSQLIIFKFLRQKIVCKDFSH